MKIAIITGASKGIGKAIAEEFVSAGYQTAFLSRNEGKLVYGRKATPLNGCDVRDRDSVNESFLQIYNMAGSIDVLVNNAGYNSRGSLEHDDWMERLDALIDGWNIEYETNVLGTFICSYVAAYYMKKGSIINISSIKAKDFSSGIAYGATKAAIEKLTVDMAHSLAPDIMVNCIAPGFIDTGMTAELPDEKKEKYKNMIPLRRFGTCSEIAEIVRDISETSYMTGAIIDVNGGYMAR
jgi:3-oxoacyl-[acyl-carrier protein] reductase